VNLDRERHESAKPKLDGEYQLAVASLSAVAAAHPRLH
jgi:hypothetical protein